MANDNEVILLTYGMVVGTYEHWQRAIEQAKKDQFPVEYPKGFTRTLNGPVIYHGIARNEDEFNAVLFGHFG